MYQKTEHNKTFNVAEIGDVLAWIESRGIKPITRFPDWRNGHTLKSIFWKDNGYWCPPETLAAALFEAGFRIRPKTETNPNAMCFNFPVTGTIEAEKLKRRPRYVPK